MVAFGDYRLAHVLGVAIQSSRVIQEHLIPTATIGHREDETTGGRVITVAGEIRDDPDYVLRLEEMRVRADDVARGLYLEDGSASINAKLGTIEAAWDAERGLEWVRYRVTFHETL